MRNKKITVVLTVILAVAVIAGVSVYAASNFGTSSDPLIAKSYLTEVFTPELMEKFSSELDKAVSQLEAKIGTVSGDTEVDTYKVVTLSNGQSITGGVGCEFLLRVGTAKAKAVYNPAMIDVSDSSALNAGSALKTNHLYMVTIDGGGITATASTVKVLVRGSYTISS